MYFIIYQVQLEDELNMAFLLGKITVSLHKRVSFPLTGPCGLRMGGIGPVKITVSSSGSGKGWDGMKL